MQRVFERDVGGLKTPLGVFEAAGASAAAATAAAATAQTASAAGAESATAPIVMRKNRQQYRTFSSGEKKHAGRRHSYRNP